jgi:crotonobetainyl-CoA:carnitine CoA-transferase CaiB-like acyl-CoA transferase
MLDDVVVLEAGSRLSTAYAGRLLCDGGATVVRLEPTGGDPLRHTSPAYAEYLHAGKGSVTDVTDTVGGRSLADRVDVVICDEDPVVQALVLELRARNPRLVVVAVSPYGLDGPDAGTPATDFTLQAEAGVFLVHPTGDRPSVAAGVPLAELSGGAAAAMAVAAGLLADDAGEAPTSADVSLLESAISLLQFPWLGDRIEGQLKYPLPQAPIPGVEEASDGWVCVVSVTPPQWKDFKRIAQIPALEDPRFDSLSDRILLAAEVTSIVREFTRRHTIDELVELGAAHRVPIVPVTTPGTITDLAPFAARETFVRSASGDFVAPGAPFRLHGTDRPAPGPLAAAGADDAGWSATTPRARGSLTGADPRRPLAGLRVVEIGTFQAGPIVTMNMANLGAEVIKIESVNRPDMVRYNGVPLTVDRSWERGAPFLGVNLGKKDITADLGDERGIAVVRQLIADADVVLENFGPRVVESHGLDYEGVRALSPDALMIRMPAWGLDGPWRERPGFTYTVNAASGMAELTGYPEGEPLLTGTVVDPFAAYVASFAALAAVRRRIVTGEGGLLEVPLCDIAVQLTAQAVVEQSATGTVKTRAGNVRSGAVPQGAFRTADGREIAISVVDDDQWAALAALPWAKAWADDRFAAAADRLSRADELDALLRQAVAEVDSAQVVAELRTAGVPAARLEVGVDAILHPQLLARDRVVEIGHPVVGPQRYLAGPVRFTEGPDFLPQGPSPLFGQHTEEVLTALGYTAEQIGQQREAGLISDSPFNAPFDRSASVL